MTSPSLRELVASNGDVRLASERLNVSVHALMSDLIGSPELHDAVMASIELQVLDVISNYKVALIASLDEMSPRDLARSFVEILTSFGGLGRGNQAAQPTPLNLLQVFNSDASSARERVISQLVPYESSGVRQVG